MPTGTTLVARPRVYTDEPDDIPELLEMLGKTPQIPCVVLDLPRGMLSPRRVSYLEEAILDGLAELGFEAEYDEQQTSGGRKRVVVVARRDGAELRWGRNMFETLILQNDATIG